MPRPYNNQLRVLSDERAVNSLLPIIESIVTAGVKKSICGHCGCLLFDSDPSCPMCRYFLLSGVSRERYSSKEVHLQVLQGGGLLAEGPETGVG